MNNNITLPLLNYKHELHPDTEEQLGMSARELSNIHPEIWGLKHAVTIHAVNLVSLDRIGGEYGYGGSRVFVACLSGKTSKNDEVTSVPLLVKVVEDNVEKADDLLDEMKRYNSIGDLLVSRHHAVPLEIFPLEEQRTDTRILWSQFLEESIVKGLPEHAPHELRYHLENSKWDQAVECLHAAYQILHTAHDTRVGNRVSFMDYSPYLRLHKSWQSELTKALGNSKFFTVFGLRTRNPLFLLKKVKDNLNDFNTVGWVSAVHGDFHPRNIIIGDITRAAIIDFGWAQPSFHTIVDFVLMEISIKFFYLPWSISRRELKIIENDLVMDFIPDQKIKDQRLAGAIKVIKAVRTHAYQYIDRSDDNWFINQYLFPLYLLTMGTFAFGAKVTNLSYLLLSAGLLAGQVESKLGL